MKIIGIAANFLNPDEERRPLPRWQNIFLKANSSLHTGNQFSYPSFSKDVWYEAELVVRLSKNLKTISAEEAHQTWDEFTLGVDWTAKDIQNDYKSKGWPWAIAKGFDQASFIGKWLKRSDFEHADEFDIRFEVNGEVRQEGNTKHLKIPVAEIISFCSSCMSLEAGDLIFTGAPPHPGPVQIGDHCQGFLNGKELLNFKVI